MNLRSQYFLFAAVTFCGGGVSAAAAEFDHRSYTVDEIRSFDVAGVKLEMTYEDAVQALTSRGYKEHSVWKRASAYDEHMISVINQKKRDGEISEQQRQNQTREYAGQRCYKNLRYIMETQDRTSPDVWVEFRENLPDHPRQSIVVSVRYALNYSPAPGEKNMREESIVRMQEQALQKYGTPSHSSGKEKRPQPGITWGTNHQSPFEMSKGPHIKTHGDTIVLKDNARAQELDRARAQYRESLRIKPDLPQKFDF